MSVLSGCAASSALTRRDRLRPGPPGGGPHRPNARFRLAAEPGETVRGGQSLAVVAPSRPEIDWDSLKGAAVE
ncbi:hypothetical protein ACFVH6_18755 [Spirillospora sp. NPDC127200]